MKRLASGLFLVVCQKFTVSEVLAASIIQAMIALVMEAASTLKYVQTSTGPHGAMTEKTSLRLWKSIIIKDPKIPFCCLLYLSATKIRPVTFELVTVYCKLILEVSLFMFCVCWMDWNLRFESYAYLQPLIYILCLFVCYADVYEYRRFKPSHVFQ